MGFLIVTDISKCRKSSNDTNSGYSFISSTDDKYQLKNINNLTI